MKTVLKSVLLLLFLILTYLFFYPTGINPQQWNPPIAPKLEGIYAQNNVLQSTTKLFEGQCVNCEDVAVDSLGRIYGGNETGAILRFNPSTGEKIMLTNTGGRPLGLDFDQSGHLIIADAHKGLLSMAPSGELSVLATTHNQVSFGFTDDLEVAPDGKIYFSDASHKLDIGEYKLDLIEHRPNGRMLVYDPLTDKTDLVLEDLYFANGIAINEDNTFVLVNETSSYRVIRYWLSGPKKGSSDIFIDNLPGFPDGISRGTDGIFWLTLISPRNSLLDKLGPKPFLRNVIARLPEFLKPKPENYGFILGLDKDGKVLFNFQDPEGGYSQISSVQQFGSALYFGSLNESSIGLFKFQK